ncbi:unnamed protein product [Caenorhabditis brenneri]
MCASRSRVYPVAERVQVQNVNGPRHDDMPVLEPEGLAGNQEIVREIVQEVVQDVAQDVVQEEPNAEDQHALELQLLRFIAEAARENENLIQTVRHFQEVVEEQTALLERRVQEQLDRDGTNANDDEDVEIDVVNVDEGDENPPVLINEQSDQSSSS